MSLDKNWFTEIHGRDGSAFSFQIKAKLHEERSEYQHLEIYDTQTYGRLMVIDGCVMLTDRDNFIYHEMMSHPVLFSHPNPRRVVIIGGGDCGTLREVLKHDVVESALQVDIDERVTRLSEKYFPELCDSNNDPRATLAFADGIKWMDEAAPGSVDVVIVDSTDPVGPAEGLFSADFFRKVWRALGEDGLLVQQSESPLYHLDSVIVAMHTALRSAGFADVRTLPFPQPVYPSGWWSCTMASKTGRVEPRRVAEADHKQLNTRYYSADIHRAALVLPPYVAAAITKAHR